MVITQAQEKRYERQIIIPEIGIAGQERLLAARVLIAGMGGLGSAAAVYLAAAGVGTLGLADGDCVELSNLQRQVIHDSDSLGRSKTDSAAQKIAALNPDVKIEVHPLKITAANVMEIIGRYDLIIECTDSFASKFLLNDACYFAGKTLCFGGVMRTEGQATTFKTKSGGPCYRCFIPGPPAPGVLPTAREAGILGVVAGLIGLVQATEAIKEILGLGETLVGRLLHYDSLAPAFDIFSYAKNPACPLCGSTPKITSLKD